MHRLLVVEKKPLIAHLGAVKQQQNSTHTHFEHLSFYIKKKLMMFKGKIEELCNHHQSTFQNIFIIP